MSKKGRIKNDLENALKMGRVMEREIITRRFEHQFVESNIDDKIETTMREIMEIVGWKNIATDPYEELKSEDFANQMQASIDALIKGENK